MAEWSADRVFSSHSLKLYWGEDAFYANAVRRTASSATEVDVTGMDSDITEDPENTDRKMIWKEVETCVADPGEVSVEFWAVAKDYKGLVSAIGCKRLLKIAERNSEGEEQTKPLVSYQAFLTQCSIDASVGEYVRGSVTFRLTGSFSEE